VRFLGPKVEGGQAQGFGSVFARLFVTSLRDDVVENLNKIKLSTTPIELNRNLVSWLCQGDISVELIIIIGFIVCQYTKYLYLVETLIRDFFYMMPEDSEHDEENLTISMMNYITSYDPSDELQALIIEGNKLIDRSCKNLQDIVDKDGEEVVRRRVCASQMAAHVDFDGDEMSRWDQIVQKSDSDDEKNH
jgi:hypothetical protein